MSLNDSLESLRQIDLNDLDFNNVGSWPAAVKFIAGALLLIAVVAFGYNFHLKDLQAQLDGKRAEEAILKEQFSSKAFQAANLPHVPLPRHAGACSHVADRHPQAHLSRHLLPPSQTPHPNIVHSEGEEVFGRSRSRWK